MKGTPRSILIAILRFTLNVLITAFIAKMFLAIKLVHSLILGLMLGGSSSITVIALSSCVECENETRAILILESTITDVL